MSARKSVLGAVGAATLALSVITAPAAGANENLKWGPCPVGAMAAPDAQCATFEAPMNYDDPSAGTITLTMSKIPAKSGKSLGAVAGNPGGPGGGALPMFAGHEKDEMGVNRVQMTQKIKDNYDLIAVEPRGLAYGEPLECSVADIPVGTLAMAVSAGLAHDVCNWTQPGYVDQVNTENTARDLNVARQALGLDKLNLYGVSYGGLLMATYATLFPQHTDRSLLDSSAAQKDQWAGISDRGEQRRDSLEAMFQWIADRDDQYGLGDTPLKVYINWSRVVQQETGVPAQLTPPPAQIGDLPPGIAEHHGVVLPAVNQAMPPSWRLFSAMYTVLSLSPGATLQSPLFQYTYYTGLYDESKWDSVARYIRDGKAPEDTKGPDIDEDDEELMKEIMLQSVTYPMVERSVVCNENRVPVQPERLIPERIEKLTGGDVINSIENSFITGEACMGWPLPNPAPTVNGDKLAIKPLHLAFSHDNAVGGDAVYDMQKRMGGEMIILDGHSHGVMVRHTDEVAPRVDAYFGL